MIYWSIGFSPREWGQRRPGGSELVGAERPRSRSGAGRARDDAEAMPVLRDGPSPEQVQAWVELAYPRRRFPRSVCRMAQHPAIERADDNQPGCMMTSPNASGPQSLGPLGTASGPSSSKDGPVVDDFVAQYAQTVDATDSTRYRMSLALRLEVANDPRTEWYWQLLSTINGCPIPASLAPVPVWFTQALRAHSRCWRGTPIRCLRATRTNSVQADSLRFLAPGPAVTHAIAVADSVLGNRSVTVRA